MDIKILGIEFELGKGITLSDYFSYVESRKGEPVVLFKYGRFMYVADIGDYHAGLLITTKDQRKYIEFKRDAKHAKLEPKDITEGSQLADFNFFLISKKTGRGIYQYYHNSCALNTFGAVCKSHYDSLKSNLIKKALKSQPDITTKVEKHIRSSFAGTLSWSILVKPENFSQLVKELKSIKSFTVSMTTLAYKETIFRPLANKAKRMTQKFRFPFGTEPNVIIGDVEKLVGLPELESARIDGMDENGLDQVVKLENTPDSFGVFDYDRIAALMNLSPNDFPTSPFMNELLKIADANKALFK